MKTTRYLLTFFMLVVGAACASAQSSTYYFKHFATAGSDLSWYDNDNSWGYHNGDNAGFTEMVMGEDWGTISPYHPIPAKLNTLSYSSKSSFTEKHVVNSGGRIDATWDNFCLPEIITNGQGSEVMIWINYTNTQPLADDYDGSGKAVAAYTNYGLNGETWNVYEKSWGDGYYTVSFVDQNPTSSLTVNTLDFMMWPTTHNPSGSSSAFYPSTWYLMEVGMGWEYSNGWASATAYSQTGW